MTPPYGGGALNYNLANQVSNYIYNYIYYIIKKRSFFYAKVVRQRCFL